jgi:hypothetical protein
VQARQGPEAGTIMKLQLIKLKLLFPEKNPPAPTRQPCRRTLHFQVPRFVQDYVVKRMTIRGSCFWAGLPDLSWSKHAKTGKIYQMTTNYTKRPYTIPNDRKISQMVMKCTNIPRPAKIYPNWDFWYEYKPSGNPWQGHPRILSGLMVWGLL